MTKLGPIFVDLQREGRLFSRIPLTSGVAMLALSRAPGDHGTPISGDEDVHLRQNGFKRITDTLYASLACHAREAGIRGLYPRARTVDFDEAKHVREALPGLEGEDPTETTLRVGISLVEAEVKSIAAYERAAGLRGDLTDSMRRAYADQATLMEDALAELVARRDDPTLPGGP